MYSLDINFLKDRPEYQPKSKGGPRPAKQQISLGALLPLYIGVGVGVFLPALVIGLGFLLQQQTTSLEERQAQLDKELGRLKGIEDQVKQIAAQTDQVTGETKALASVFNQIKPWSAMLQDIRERIPPNVQIQTIQQTQVAAPPPAVTTPPPPATPNAAPPVAPPPITKLLITGTARSFNDVNDFLLTLQRSSFFNSDETQLVSAKLIENPTPVELPKVKTQSNAAVIIKLPKVVQYSIQTNLNDVSASELIRELDRKGAVGLVTRLRTLQEKGVIQQ